MGYLVPYGYSKADVVKEVTSGSDAYSVYGSEVYALHTDAKTGKKFIAVILVKKIDGHYGYKYMTETDGPYYYNCPKNILDKSEMTDERSTKWRNLCLEAKGKKLVSKNLLENLIIGKEKMFSCNGRNAKFISTFSKGYIVGKDVESGMVYRYKKGSILPAV